jgi:two-component system phosphate regulon sensor histidine kinase PhoR
MTDGVVVVDQAGRVHLVNQAFEEMFGLSASEAEGRPLEEVALNFELSLLLRRALERQTVERGEIRLLQPEPARTLYGVANPLLDEAGRTIGAVGLLRDVTERNLMDQVRRDFVANASHELRTPAAGIRALAEVLQEGALHDPEKAGEFVQRILAEAARLTEILDDMLTLTRVERGPELLKPRWTVAAEALEEAVAHVHTAALVKAITLAAEAGAEERVYADPGALQTVLINLLDNAVKYTPEGGEVRVAGRPVPGGYEIAVTDSGVGIAEEHLPRIFERFYRADKARSRATGGTGLGLAIVKHIVEAHRGKVTVRSALDQGSTFTVFFPLAPESLLNPTLTAG